MSVLYDRIIKLCESKGITGYRLCKDIGISPNVITELKMDRRDGVSAKTADKIANYFGVSVGFLLGTEQKEKATIDVVDDDLREYLDELRNRPEMRMLFSTTKNATKAQIEAIVKFIEGMQEK